MIFTQEEATFLYQLLDQINVRGEAQKLIVLQIMQKLRSMQEPKETSDASKEEEPDA